MYNSLKDVCLSCESTSNVLKQLPYNEQVRSKKGVANAKGAHPPPGKSVGG